jgi:hypothetical protein
MTLRQQACEVRRDRPLEMDVQLGLGKCVYVGRIRDVG